jgi:hypothetical protein
LGLLEGVKGALVFVEVSKALGFGGIVGGDVASGGCSVFFVSKVIVHSLICQK